LRNIDKKWALFAIATAVSFYGICYTLIQSTFSIEYEYPIDSHFEDMNFYKCVVDSYNLEFSMDNSYEDVMDYEKLKKLSILKCNKNENTLEQDKIISVKGIEILTGLENVSLAYNNISNIDLSNNTRLLSLDVSYNNLYDVDLRKNERLQFLNINGSKFVKDLYVYNGNNIRLDGGIKLSSDLILNDIKWEVMGDNDIILLNEIIYGEKDGTATIYGKSNLGYDIINNINVISITSNKYQIDEENNNIYIENINNFDIQDIVCSNDNVVLEMYTNDMKLYVKYNDNVLKEFNIIETIKDA